MNKFIQLTDYEDDLPFCINVEKIDLFSQLYDTEGSPTLILTLGGCIPVKETFEQLKILLKNADN